MIRFPRYDSYKDSGMAWLGEIPAAWSLQSIRSVTELKSDRNQPDLPVLSVYREFGVILKDSRDDNHNATALDTSTYKVVEPGDLVVNKMKAWQGSMGVSEHKGIVSPAYITCRVDTNTVIPKFLHYLLRSRPYIGIYSSLSYGVRVGQWDMHYEDFKKIPLPLPTKNEQTRIASFLDEKTAEIDDAIAKKQRLIELLQEQKAILINRAVTQGLDPNVSMRDSGVAWIGQIPAHWEVLPLTKHVESIVDYRGQTPTKVENGTFLVTARNIKNGEIDYEISKEYVSSQKYDAIMSRGKPQIGDLLFTTEAPLGGVALIDREDIALAQRIIKFRLDRQFFHPEFVKFSMMAVYFQDFLASEATGSTALGIKASKLHKLRIITPPIDEQKMILDILKSLLSDAENGINAANLAVSLLNEFRSILISDAVTGKIKV